MTDTTPTTTAAHLAWLRHEFRQLWDADEHTLQHRRTCTNEADRGCRLLQAIEGIEAGLAAAERAQTSIRALIAKWREKANESGLEATRIYNTVKVHTDAQERCYARADVWKRCADDMEAALRTADALPQPPRREQWCIACAEGHHVQCLGGRCECAHLVPAPTVAEGGATPPLFPIVCRVCGQFIQCGCTAVRLPRPVPSVSGETRTPRS